MKYKYSRKEFLKKVGFLFSKGKILVPNEVDGEELMKLLLAQKEDKKECKHKFGETYTGGKRCNKCNMSLTEFKYSTPSPLEIEEIETLKHRFMSGKNHCWRELSLQDQKINSLIRNQKKLYQLIKEKQK